jgi:hypothetical protein
MQNFYFQGRSPTPEQRERISIQFGNLRYHVTTKHLRVEDGGHKLLAAYMVSAETASTITLHFSRNDGMPELTLYRVSSDLLFIRSGSNFEYFRRVAA